MSTCPTSQLRKLTRDEYGELDQMMRDVPDPEVTYTATGWHYQLANLLRTFDIRVTGRFDAYNIGVALWEQTPDD